MVGVDRISELPEPILHHILSFLPLKQIAQTAVVSKTWNRAWSTYPVLEFDRTILKRKLYYYYSGDMLLTREEKLKELRRRRKKLFNCLEQALRNRHCREMISMKKFKVDVFLFEDPMFISFMERCIFHAIGSNVKELSLEFVCGRHRWYSLPQIVLFAESVELLKLKGCRFELLGNNMQLSSLRKLYLSHVSVNDHVIECLVSGCRMIEDINLNFCDGLKNLKLFGLSRLNDVKIINSNDLERLNIEASNIQSMDIYWLSPSCVINVNPYMNIKQLGLRSVRTKDWLCSVISRLPFLEGLSIWECFQLRNAEISNPCLKKLLFNGCMELVELKIDTPNLQCLAYSGDIISMSLNALALSELVLELPWRPFDSQWFFNYIELLAKFRSCSQVINLQSTAEKSMIIPRKLRQELPSPLSSVKHLNLKLESTPFPSEISEVLDGLLWISPHTKTISIEYGGCNNSRFKFQFSYKKQLTYEGKFASCCNTIPLLCWQHCIEEVNLEVSSEICEMGKNMKSYTLNGADILEKIDTFCGVAGSYSLFDFDMLLDFT